MDDASRYLALAHRLADAAGEIIRPYFRADIEIITKDDESPVTIADREAEWAMRVIIEAECPEHGIRGEEFPEKFGDQSGDGGSDGHWHWYLDPIDGTKLFITGIPLFGTLIGLAHNGKPVLGIMDQPISGERWVGAIYGSASLNGAAVRTSSNENLAQARFFTTATTYYDDEQMAGFNRLSEACAMTRMGTDCYAFAMLASGFVDIVTEGRFNEWDIAALIPIIVNAGGVVTDWDGQPLRFDGQVTIEHTLAAANPALHAKALAALRG